MALATQGHTWDPLLDIKLDTNQSSFDVPLDILPTVRQVMYMRYISPNGNSFGSNSDYNITLVDEDKNGPCNPGIEKSDTIEIIPTIPPNYLRTKITVYSNITKRQLLKLTLFLTTGKVLAQGTKCPRWRDEEFKKLVTCVNYFTSRKPLPPPYLSSLQVPIPVESPVRSSPRLRSIQFTTAALPPPPLCTEASATEATQRQVGDVIASALHRDPPSSHDTPHCLVPVTAAAASAAATTESGGQSGVERVSPPSTDHVASLAPVFVATDGTEGDLPSSSPSSPPPTTPPTSPAAIDSPRPSTPVETAAATVSGAQDVTEGSGATDTHTVQTEPSIESSAPLTPSKITPTNEPLFSLKEVQDMIAIAIADCEARIKNSLKFEIRSKSQGVCERMESLEVKIQSLEKTKRDMNSELKDLKKQIRDLKDTSRQQQSPPPGDTQQQRPHGDTRQSPPPGDNRQSPPPGDRQQQSPPPGDDNAPRQQRQQQSPPSGDAPRQSPRERLSAQRVHPQTTHLVIGDSTTRTLKADLTFPGKKAENVSVSGLTLNDLSHWLANIPAAKQVKVVVLHIGINSCQTDSISKDKWAKIIRLTKKVFPSANVYICSLIPPRGAHPLKKSALDSNEQLRQACLVEHCVFIDSRSIFTTQRGAPKQRLYKDALHPSPSGVASLGCLIHDKVMLQVVDSTPPVRPSSVRPASFPGQSQGQSESVPGHAPLASSPPPHHPDQNRPRPPPPYRPPPHAAQHGPVHFPPPTPLPPGAVPTWGHSPYGPWPREGWLYRMAEGSGPLAMPWGRDPTHFAPPGRQMAGMFGQPFAMPWGCDAPQCALTPEAFYRSTYV